MPESHFEVGVIVARRKLKGPWVDHAWLPYAALPAAAAAAPWTRLSAGDSYEDRRPVVLPRDASPSGDGRTSGVQ